MFKRVLSLTALTGLMLQGCWVPQVVQGVKPELFPSTAPDNPLLAKLSLESKQVSMATTAIVCARIAAEVYLSGSLASHRQALESHLYYNVQSLDSFAGWQFIKPENSYVYYNSSDGSRFNLEFLDTSGSRFDGFDLMGFSSYGPEPQPAQKFPAEISRYQLGLQRARFQDNATINLDLNAVWPTQIPLREQYQTELNGTGSVQDHPYLENMSLKIDGITSSDHSQINGQLSFSASIEGRIYNGFGRFDKSGFVDSVSLEHNGLHILQIQRQNNGSWDVLRDQKVVATTY